MNYKETAKGILEHVGGVENISNMSHCATRLRLNLKDETLANDEDVKAVDGVVNVINKAGQYQVLIGIEVPHVFEEFEKLVKGNGNVEMSESNEDEGIISKVFSAISAIFAPLLPALAGSGILRGLLILAVQLGMIKEGSGTYTILYSTSMAVFYFLPVLLAFTSGKRFGASPYISALIGAALLHPVYPLLPAKLSLHPTHSTSHLYGHSNYPYGKSHPPNRWLVHVLPIWSE